MTTPPRPHVMLTSLGTNPSDTVYTLDGREHASNVAAAALYALLPEAERPERIIVLCTQQAEQISLPAFRDALGSEAWKINHVRVSEENTEEAVRQFLATLVDSVPPDVDLTVDVTQGFRHQAFLTYTGVLYLTALRGVRLRNAFYGMLVQGRPPRRPETPRDTGAARLDEKPDPSRFLDVKPLVELPQWFHAVRILKDTGSTHAIADLVKGSDPETTQVRESLRRLAEAHSSGLPIELGYLAAQFMEHHAENLRNLLRAQGLPLADQLVQDLVGTLEQQRLPQRYLRWPDWKSRIELNRAELRRQARIIDGYVARIDYPTAIKLMREWMVLWAMWRTNRVSDWLNHEDGREPTRKALNTLRRQQTDRDRAIRRRQASTVTLTPEQDWVATVWGHLVDLRNPYAHHGLDKKVTLSSEIQVRRRTDAVIDAWRERLRNVPELPLELPYPQETRRR